jgi:hypothetical protein
LLEAVVDLIMPDGTKAADLRSAADDNTAKNDMAPNFILSVRQYFQRNLQLATSIWEVNRIKQGF